MDGSKDKEKRDLKDEDERNSDKDRERTSGIIPVAI